MCRRKKVVVRQRDCVLFFRKERFSKMKTNNKCAVMMFQLALCFLVACLPASVEGGVQLSHMKTAYIPYSLSPNLKYGLDTKVMEQIAYHSEDKLVYAVGREMLTVLDMSTVSNLSITHSAKLDGEDITDVEVCGDYVFIATTDLPMSGRGFVKVYHKYDQAERELKLAHVIEVGSLPDMVLPYSDCSKVIVVLEGERYQHPTSGEWIDPIGEVAILEFPHGLDNGTFELTKLNFTKFDSQFSDLKAQGVRQAYTLHQTPFSTDTEPEYVTVDEDTMTAYIGLQESNAIAEVDLTEKVIKDVHGLGSKQWGYFDASSKGNEISVSLWPIRAWYQPDSIYLKHFREQRLIFTANEGDKKEYEDDDSFDERIKGRDIHEDDVGDSILPWVKEALKDDKRLGQLRFAKYDGLQNNTYNALYTFGGRSWSIRDTDNNMELLYDSGSDIEEKTALLCPHLFNRNGDEEEIDEESPKMGPQPEAIKAVEIDDRLYVFIGIERPGMVMVYSIGSDVTKPRFEQLFCHGLPDDSMTPQQLYDARRIYALDVEDIRFIPTSESPEDHPLLLVAGSVSGTVSVLKVEVTEEPIDVPQLGDQHGPQPGGNNALGVHNGHLLLSIVIATITGLLI